MHLTAVIYELFESDAHWLDDHPADPIHSIDREIRLRFADAPDCFISWDVAKRSTLYEVSMTSKPHFDDAPFESRDMSRSALWAPLINAEVEILPLGRYRFVVEIRGGSTSVFCCARENGRWGMDTLEITSDRPSYPRSALVGDWPLRPPSAEELATLSRSALFAYLLRLVRRSAWEYAQCQSHSADEEAPSGEALDRCFSQIASALARDDSDQLTAAIEWLTPITIAMRVHGIGPLGANACHSAILSALGDALRGGELIHHINIACDSFLKLAEFRDNSWSNEWRPTRRQRLAALRADFELLRQAAAEHHWTTPATIQDFSFPTDIAEYDSDLEK